MAAPSSTPSLSPTELATFLLLRAKVSKEQEDYRRFQALEGTVNKDKYFVIRPEVEKQLEVTVFCCLTQVKQVTALKRERLIKYPRYYDIHSAFDLRVVKSNVNDPILTHKSTVLQQGKVLMFKRPTVNEIPVTHNYMLKKVRSTSSNVEVYLQKSESRRSKKLPYAFLQTTLKRLTNSLLVGNTAL